MTFKGFPKDALAFYEGLEADNSKVFWQANKSEYESSVKGPMLALAAAVEAEFGPLSIFRPNRDIRFSKDKSPYKTAIGASTEGEGGELYYVQFSTAGLMAASGYYMMATDQLERFRAALLDDEHGPEIAVIAASVENDGYSLGAHDELKTAPRGIPKDHPRIALLRRKGLILSRSFSPAAWLSTPKALNRVLDTWRAARELNNWLNQHVGPSLVAPPGADGW